MSVHEYDFRWLRVGWFDQDRPCDRAVQYITKQLPGDTLPARWQADSPLHFTEQFGEGIKWSKAASYHLLVIGGHPLIRIWTNADRKILVEVADRFVSYLEDANIAIEDIPLSVQKKRKPFRYRFRLTLPEELDYLVNIIKVLYGVAD